MAVSPLSVTNLHQNEPFVR